MVNWRDQLGNWVFLGRNRVEHFATRLPWRHARPAGAPTEAPVAPPVQESAASKASKRKQLVPVVASVLMLGVAAMVTVKNFYHPSRVKAFTAPPRYYMDLKTGKLFAAVNQVPPIVAPSGARDAHGNGTGVLAMVYSCGDCADEADRFVGLLESTDPSQVDPAQKAELAAMMFAPGMAGRTMDPRLKGIIVASPDARGRWLPRVDPEGQQLIGAAASRCNEEGRPTRQCSPPASPASPASPAPPAPPAS